MKFSPYKKGVWKRFADADGGGGGDSSVKCPDVCVGDLKMHP